MPYFFIFVKSVKANFKMGGFRNSEAGRLNCYLVSI